MTAALSTHSLDADYPVSLGSAVRQLRLCRGLTQGKLAAVAGIRTSRLGQIERGARLPDVRVLVALAQGLGIDVAEIDGLTEKTLLLRHELRDLLEHLLIPRENWGEFLALAPEVLGLLVEALRAQLPTRAGILRQVEEIADAIERDGVDATVESLLRGILLNGLPPIDYMRSSVQMEELPGERIIFADRLPISPATVPIDELFLFRASYGIDPSNPKLLKWWSDARRTALVATLKEYGSRTIIPIDRLERYIRTGERGPKIILPPDVVLAHLVAVIDLLRKNPNFMIGLSETRFPVTYRVKGDRNVIVSLSDYELGPNPQVSKMMLRFSRGSVAAQFRRHFEAIWQGIPDGQRDSERVANWLERQLPNVGRGERQ
ncbi:MAG TPA: helix-turn-helix transcriptional regulator [Nitrolancea sp.]|nr:helix-turn-helix transcriptional regulator [Nitrolancea sp.]